MLTYIKNLEPTLPFLAWVTPILVLIQTWFYNYILFDSIMIINMFCIVIIDTVLGVAVAYKLKVISSNSFSKVFTKILVYMALLISTHIATHFASHTQNSLLLWVDSVLYSAVFIRELLSIFEKTAKLGIFTVPDYILKRLKDFDDNGKAK